MQGFDICKLLLQIRAYGHGSLLRPQLASNFSLHWPGIPELTCQYESFKVYTAQDAKYAFKKGETEKLLYS